MIDSFLKTDWSLDTIVARRDRHYAASQSKFVPFADPMIFSKGN